MSGFAESTAPYAFISYASADRARVAPVIAALQGAGVPVWLDRQDIGAGENYALEIAEAIERAAVLVLCCSAASLASRNVRQEVALAWKYERPYVPLLLELVAIPKELEYWLEAAQWVELLDRPASAWLPAVLAALAQYGIIPAPSAPPPAATLAGRERELALLRERLDAALAGRGGLVLVGGEAGVGKTTLVEALLAEAGTHGALALTGRCYDLAETPPYGPWVELFGRYRPGPADPPHPSAFAARGMVGAVASQAALLAQVRDWLAALATTRPVALLLDDLHWADPASLDLLRAIARDLADLPALILATYRADELTRRHPLYQLLPTLEREARATRLDLRRFDDSGVRALVADRYALPDADAARLVAWLVGRAEGNAFFTTQLLRALEEEGLLGETGDGWLLGDLGAVGLPAPLRQMLDARLARLGEASHRLLTLAAVIGQEVPLALWAAVAETDEDGLLDTIDGAVDARLLAVAPDGAAARFAHALIREALYEALVATRRRRVHRRVGEALVATPGPDPDAVAYHFRQAGDPRAYAWLLRAGERARRGADMVGAAARFEAALALLDTAGDATAERGWLLLRIARLRRFSDTRRTVAIFEEAERLAAAVGDPLLAACAHYWRGESRLYAGSFRQGVDELEAGFAALEALPTTELARLGPLTRAGIAERCLGGGLLANGLVLVGRYAAVHAVHARLTPETPLAAAIGVAGQFLLSSAIIAAAEGRPQEARRRFADERDDVRLRGNEVLVGSAALWELIVCTLPYWADDVAARRQLALLGERAWQRAEGAHGDVSTHLISLPLLVVEGLWGEARDLAKATLAHSTNALRRHLYMPLLGKVLLAQGDSPLAWRLVDELLPEGPQTAPGGTTYLSALALQRLAATLALDAGDVPLAGQWLGAHDRWLAWSGATLGRAEGALGWAQYHRAAGDTAEARTQAEGGLSTASEPRQPLALLAAHRLLGELATVAGRHADAEAHLANALALAEACAAPYERALTLLAQAELRAAEGQADVARALLAEVRAICEPLGARPALARAGALAARLGAG